MVEKPVWELGEPSPWADDPDPPTVLQVAQAYPHQALWTAFFMFCVGMILTPIIARAAAWLVDALVGIEIFASPWPVFALVPFVWAGLWWGGMFLGIRGLIESDD